MKHTQYFLHTRGRTDRAMIREEWIQRVLEHPAKEAIQTDGRIRRWGKVPEMQDRV